jgi:hypothetical protein
MIYTVGPEELVFNDKYNKLKLLEDEEPRRWRTKKMRAQKMKAY